MISKYCGLNSKKILSYLNLQSEQKLINTTVNIIAIGMYINIPSSNCERLGELSNDFVNGITKLTQSIKNAFCEHSYDSSAIYLFNCYELKFNEIVNKLYSLLADFKIKYSTIHFSSGIDRRTIHNVQDIYKSELMACFRMYKNIYSNLSSSSIYACNQIWFVDAVQKVLNNTLEYNDYDLNCEDVLEISSYLDMLMNKYICLST